MHAPSILLQAYLHVCNGIPHPSFKCVCNVTPHLSPELIKEKWAHTCSALTASTLELSLSSPVLVCQRSLWHVRTSVAASLARHSESSSLLRHSIGGVVYSQAFKSLQATSVRQCRVRCITSSASRISSTRSKLL
eukprot:1151440-Pelagomonas_calceolata.AAC.2